MLFQAVVIFLPISIFFKILSNGGKVNCSLETCLHFPDVESTPFLFKIDQYQLDSAVGFVVDHFKGIAIKSPANGAVRINEVQEKANRKSLWVLNITENGQEINPEMAEGNVNCKRHY